MKTPTPNIPTSISVGPEAPPIPTVPSGVETPALAQPSAAETAAQAPVAQTGSDIFAETIAQEGTRQGLQDLASGEIAQEAIAVPTEPTMGERAAPAGAEAAANQAPSPDNPQPANEQSEPQPAQQTAEGQQATAPEAQSQTAMAGKFLEKLGITEDVTQEELNNIEEQLKRVMALSERRFTGPKDAVRDMGTLIQQALADKQKPLVSADRINDVAKEILYGFKAKHFLENELYLKDNKLKQEIDNRIKEERATLERYNASLSPQLEEEIKLQIIKAYLLRKDFPPPKNILETIINLVGFVISQIDNFFKGMMPQQQH